MSMIYLAKYTCTKQDKTYAYVGKTRQETLEQRIEQHKRQALSNSSTSFHQAMLNYGLSNWEWSVLEECDQAEESHKEKEWIERFCQIINIEVLNTSFAQKIKLNAASKPKMYVAPLSARCKTQEKSKLGKTFLRLSGKLKPIINLKTQRIYESSLEASRKEAVSIDKVRKSATTGKMLEDGTRYAYLDLDDKPIFVEGHKRDVCIGRNAKKVKNLISGKVYYGTAQASKQYGVSKSTIEGAAKGDYLIVKEKFVFCFLDENDQEIITPKHLKALDILKKKNQINYVAWHVNDVERTQPCYFKSIKELCQELKIRNKSHVKSVCDGNRSHAEKWRIAYFNSETNEPILKETHLSKANKTMEKIICLNDGNIYTNCTEAGKFYSIGACLVGQCARGESKSVYRKLPESNKKERLRFAYLDLNNNPVLTATHKLAQETLAARGDKRIMLINKEISERTVFNSLAEYCRITGVPPKRAKKYAKDKSVDLLGYEYIELD